MSVSVSVSDELVLVAAGPVVRGGRDGAVVLAGRSVACQLIWIMGARMVKLAIDALLFGTVTVDVLLLVPSQLIVGRVVDTITWIQVWPLKLPQAYPLEPVSTMVPRRWLNIYLGQHPTAVSSAPSRNCMFQPALPSRPPTAEQAVTYPDGHSIPGEYIPHPGADLDGAPLDVGGQHVVASFPSPFEHVCPRLAMFRADFPKPRNPVLSTPIAAVHSGGGIKVVVSAPRIVGAWFTRMFDIVMTGVSHFQKKWY